jgi:phenylalanyl-tRNA synthetase beta chain
MLTSIRWLNRYLEAGSLGPVTADEAEHVLTHAGFPIESCEQLSGGDCKLDVELTSNRGDCLSHFGLAREMAAKTGRKLLPPEGSSRLKGVKNFGPAVGGVTSLENKVGPLCPRFTVRVIKGVKVGPSPAWLREALEAVGQRSINNLVDVTNYVLLEMGHPSHVFDLNTLEGKRLIVRHAVVGEKLSVLDGKTHTLQPTDVVVADASKAQSLAGVIGGLPTGVTEKTADVLLEMATWDPATVRRTARRCDIRTDASHRFERYVDPRDIDEAAARAAALILEVAGGTLCDGVIDVWGAPKNPQAEIPLRLARCEHLLGIKVPTPEIVRLLTAIGINVAGFGTTGAGDSETLRCVVPNHRHDLTREVDLIEEIARLHGLDKFNVAPSLGVNLDLRHPAEWARREKAHAEVARVLNGMGFFETVTFSFATETDAESFLPPGLRLVKVDEDRRKDMPCLRPSTLSGLLNCRRGNRDAGVRVEGGVRLFEIAAVFAEKDDGKAFARATIENINLGLLMDAPTEGNDHDNLQAAVRALRGVVERILQGVGGQSAHLTVDAAASPIPAITPGTFARLSVNSTPLGYAGLIAGKELERWGLDVPVAVAEVGMRELVALFPPAARAHLLPAFPGIERDLSVIVNEAVAWKSIDDIVAGAGLARLEGHRFVGTYRGKQIGAGKKSVTFRMTFRDPERTLRHEEVDPQVSSLVAMLKERVGAELRA